MSAHTPAPWNVERPYGEPGVYVGGPDTSLVAKVWHDNEANARLIAAAPNLLESLESVLVAEYGRKGERGENNPPAWVKHAWTVVHAAKGGAS